LQVYSSLKNADMKSSQFEINAKLKLTNVPGDGNCGYWAIENHLDGESLSDIREKALKELELNRTSFEKSFGGENFQDGFEKQRGENCLERIRVLFHREGSSERIPK
jgi:hypothetical protein